jgi:hypothetical protein
MMDEYLEKGEVVSWRIFVQTSTGLNIEIDTSELADSAGELIDDLIRSQGYTTAYYAY